MKNKIALLITVFLFVAFNVLAQTGIKEYTAGHLFYVSLPDYMKKTTGLNGYATIQFKNSVKDN